jgi:hypothetical protein
VPEEAPKPPKTISLLSRVAANPKLAQADGALPVSSIFDHVTVVGLSRYSTSDVNVLPHPPNKYTTPSGADVNPMLLLPEGRSPIEVSLDHKWAPELKE